MSKFETSPIAALIGLCAVLPGSGHVLAAEPHDHVTAAEPLDRAMAAEPSPAARGLKAVDWLVHGRIIGMIPTERTSRLAVIGGRIDTPYAVLPDLDVSYFLTDHLAVSGQAGAIRTRPVIRNSLAGDIAIGSIWNAAVSGVVRYHFLPDARFNPYLGVGASATTPIAIQPAKGVPSFKVAPQASPLLQAGFDIHLIGNWFGNAMVKYIFVPPAAYTIAGRAMKVDLNMLVVGAGIGYRF